MRITVDGEPIDDPGRSSADIQRCTDVALDQADIQFQFDNLESRPRLSVAAHPRAVAVTGQGDTAVAPPVRFRMYANYGPSSTARVRIFDTRPSRARRRRWRSSPVDRGRLRGVAADGGAASQGRRAS